MIIEVPPEADDSTALELISDALPDVSTAELRTLLRYDGVRAQDRPCNAGTRLKAGARLVRFKGSGGCGRRPTGSG